VAAAEARVRPLGRLRACLVAQPTSDIPTWTDILQFVRPVRAFWAVPTSTKNGLSALPR
jgi:hypothetical protein